MSVKFKKLLLLYCFLASAPFGGWGESFRTSVAGAVEVSPHNPAGVSLAIGYNGAVFIDAGEGFRFCKGVQVELSAPRNWLSYWGSLGLALYADMADADKKTAAADLEARRVYFELLPNKLQSVYQIPVRHSHGLRNSPYSTVIQEVLPDGSFPLLFRLLPVIKGLSSEVENMSFQLSVKPIVSDEGAVRFTFRYPEQLAGKPFTVLVDDILLEEVSGEQILKEGEHYLSVLSDDYRNENRRFMIERARVLDLTVELRDPAPLILFEGPRDARIFLDNVPVTAGGDPLPVEPGVHEIRFQVSDYTIIKTLTVQRGKTYRASLTVDLAVSEE
ncbi:MAG: hypothetical protein LBL44_07225 [Treponema sp.]|jgi:hypothetical protein|nr:hypothetical protein [Treponema sp.]